MFAPLSDTSSSFLLLLLNAGLRSLLFACFVGAMLAAFRVRSVRHKLIAWRATLVLALAMPLLLLQIPRVPVPVPLGGPAQPAPYAAASALPQVAPPMQMAASLPASGVQDFTLAPKNDVTPGVASTPETGSAVWNDARGAGLSWPLAGLAIELAVALLLLSRVLVGAYFASRLLGMSSAIQDGEANQLLSRVCREVGVLRLPRLLESAAVRVPVTFGINDPAILLPSSWREWRTAELAAVMTHEASHVARGDALIQRMALIHRAVFWFSPLSWWLERHLADLAEQASDEAALAAGADRAGYAEALLGFVAELEAAPTRVWWQGVAMAKAGRSEKRVERILAWKSAMPNKMSKALAVAVVVVCTPVVAIAVSAKPSPYAAQELALPAALQPPPPPVLQPPSASVPMAVPAVPPAAAPGPAPDIAAPAVVPALPSKPAAVAIPAPKPLTRQSAAAPAPPGSQSPAPPMPVPPPVGGWTGWGWGPRFVIVSNGSEIINGSEEDAELARALRSKIHGDFIWFEQNGKSYIIRDQALVERARKIWVPRWNQAKLQHDLRQKERALSEQMYEQVQQKMQEIRVKVPDMTVELEKLQSELKNLNGNGATVRQLGDLQREVGQLQQALNEARWNSNMQQITQRAGELGRQMGEIGRQIGEIARQQVQAGERAAEQMRQLFDSAIASGAAKPE